jgi:ABC-2 type transport system permease protein
MTGFFTLLYKEILRFWKVAFQTVAAPVLTALLYLLIFTHVLENRVEVRNLDYTTFLVPGLIMMSVLQNAFANSSSSLIQAKVTGSIIFVLLPPISCIEFFFAYIGASILRGLMVGLAMLTITSFLVELEFVAPWWILTFALIGGGLMGSLGMIAGIWAEKFDQIAAFQNFLILPLTMLSGVFYSIHSLPFFWQQASRLNPFFYLIDGLRYGFFGVSDISPFTSLSVALTAFLLTGALSLGLLRSGYKLRY